MTEISYMHKVLREPVATGYGLAEVPGSAEAPVPMRDDITTSALQVEFDPRANDVAPTGALTVTEVTQPAIGAAAIVTGGASVQWSRTVTTAVQTEFDYTVQNAAGRIGTGRVRISASAYTPPSGGTTNELPTALRTVNVSTYAQLTTALTNALPGDRIILANGDYKGSDINIAASKSGTLQAPIVIVAATRLQAKVMFKITSAASYYYFYGLRFTEDPDSNRTGRLSLSGSFCKIMRCEFDRWWGDNSATEAGGPAHAILFTGGRASEVRYCYFHDPKPWSQAEILADAQTDSLRIFLRVGGGNTASFHTDGIISKCYFGSTILRPNPGVYNSQADLLEIGFNGSSYPQSAADIQAGVKLAGWVIEDTIFDATGRLGRPAGYTGSHTGNVDPNASGVVDAKIGGVTFQRCRFANFLYTGTQYTGNMGRLDLRFGANSTIKSCYFENAHIGVQGYGHLIAGNNMATNAEILLLTGSMEWSSFTGTGQQRTHSAKCISNKGILRVGRSFGGTLEVQNTRVEAHVGTVYTQQDYGTNSQVLTALRETGTTFSATASQTVTLGTAVQLAEVGPNAGL